MKRGEFNEHERMTCTDEALTQLEKSPSQTLYGGYLIKFINRKLFRRRPTFFFHLRKKETTTADRLLLRTVCADENTTLELNQSCFDKKNTEHDHIVTEPL